MKILFLAPASSIHTVRWVNALAQKNEVYLVSLPNHKMIDDGIDLKVKINYLPISGGKGYYLNGNALKKLARQLNADIVNVHYASGYGTLARIAHLPNIILSVWGSDVYDFPYRNRINMYIIKKNLLYAKHIVSTSEAMKIQVLNILDKKIEIDVVPFGVDVKKFKCCREKRKDDKFIFCVIKSLENIYGIDIIIKAFDAFLKRKNIYDKNIELHIYGKGSEKENLQELGKQYKCDSSIKWKGYIKNENLPNVLSQVDVFCSGSRKESFGVSTIEAMAAGIPVIATETDGSKEIILNDTTGILVPQESIKEMSEKMEYLYDNFDARREMGIEGRKRVETLYCWSKNVDRMNEIYERVEQEIK